MFKLKLRIVLVLLSATVALAAVMTFSLVRYFVWDLDGLGLQINPDLPFGCGTTNDDFFYHEDYMLTSNGSPFYQAGRSLFINNCSSCHAINSIIVGPALANISERRSKEWIYSFVKNSQGLIQSGDSTAVDIYNQYGKQQMPSFAFSDSEIDSIIFFIEQAGNVVYPMAKESGSD